MRELFNSVIDRVLEEIDGVTDPARRGDILANLAIALSNVIGGEEGHQKRKKYKEEKPSRKDFAEELADKNLEEIENEPEESIYILQNDSLKNKFDKEVTTIMEAKELWGEEELNKISNDFAKKEICLKNYLTKDNISEFVDYLQEIAVFKDYLLSYDKESLDACFAQFTEGAHKSIDEVTRDNIKGFNVYIKQLEEQAQSA